MTGKVGIFMSLHAPPNNRRMFSDLAGDWETLRNLSLKPPVPVSDCCIPSKPAQLFSCPSFGCSRHTSPCRCVVHTPQRTNTEPVFHHASGVNNEVLNAGLGGREVTLGDATLANNSGLYQEPGARSSTFAVAQESREASIKAAGVAPEPLIALHEPEGTPFLNEQRGVNELWGTPKSSPYHASASAVPSPAASFAPRSPRPGPKALSSSSPQQQQQRQYVAMKTTNNRLDNHETYPSRIAHTSSETREQQQLPVDISPCSIHEKNMRRFHSWYAQRESIRQERRDRYRRSANKMLPEFREAFPSLKKPEDLLKRCERVQRIHQECLQNWLPYTDRHPLAKKSHPLRKQRQRQRNANSPQPSSFDTQGQYTSGQSTLQPASTSTKHYLEETVPQCASEDSYTYSTSEKSALFQTSDMFRQTNIPYPDTNTAMYAAASVAPENVVIPPLLQQQYPFAGIQTTWQQPLASSIPLFNTGNEQKQLYPQQYFGPPFNFPCSSPAELNAATVPPHMGYQQPFNPSSFLWNVPNNPIIAPRQQPVLFSTPMPIEHNPSHFAAPSVVNSALSDVYGPFSVFAPETTHPHLPPPVCFPRSDLQMAQHPSGQSGAYTHVPLPRGKQSTAEGDSGREKQKATQKGFEKAERAAASGVTAKRTSKVNGVATSRPKTTEKGKTTTHLETPQKTKESAPRTASPAKRRAAAPGLSGKSDSEQGKAGVLQRDAARSKLITFKPPVVERLRRPTPSADRRESLELGLIKGTAEHKMTPLFKTETTSPPLQERLNRRLPIPKTPLDTSPRRPALEKPPSETPVLQEIRSPPFSNNLPPTPTLSPTTKPALDTTTTAPSDKQLQSLVGKSEQEQPAQTFDAPGANEIPDEQMRYSTVEPHTSGPTYHVRLHSDYRGPHIIQEESHRPFEDPQPIVLRVVGGREREEQQHHLTTRDSAQNVVAITPCYQEQPYSTAVLWERKEEPRYAPQTLVERAAEQVVENDEATFTEGSEVSSSHSRSSETSGVTETDGTEEFFDDRSQNSAETAVFVPLACPSAPVFKYTRRRTLPPLITKIRR